MKEDGVYEAAFFVFVYFGSFLQYILCCFPCLINLLFAMRCLFVHISSLLINILAQYILGVPLP